MVRELSWYYVLLDFLGVEGLTEGNKGCEKKEEDKIIFSLPRKKLDVPGNVVCVLLFIIQKHRCI